MNKFPKSERLHNKSSIATLFSKGQHLVVYPLKLVYLKKERLDHALPNQMLVTVPKGRFKRAVDRNLLKRRIREAYRLNRQLIRQPEDFYLLIGYIYIGKELHNYHLIEEKLKQSLLRLNKVIGT